MTTNGAEAWETLLAADPETLERRMRRVHRAERSILEPSTHVTGE